MTVQLTVRLFGTLSLRVTDYNHKTGIPVVVPDGVTPEDILKKLQIPLSHVGVISDGHSTLKRDSLLWDGMEINFFSLISGG
jgi:hypothetical protein